MNGSQIHAIQLIYTLNTGNFFFFCGKYVPIEKFAATWILDYILTFAYQYIIMDDYYKDEYNAIQNYEN